jgi:hypothetical protein
VGRIVLQIHRVIQHRGGSCEAATNAHTIIDDRLCMDDW